jgi:hypothetical protein
MYVREVLWFDINFGGWFGDLDGVGFNGCVCFGRGGSERGESISGTGYTRGVGGVSGVGFVPPT